MLFLLASAVIAGEPALGLPWNQYNGNYYCAATMSPAAMSSQNIHRYEGKFNVPLKPREEPGKVLFLWPGVNPYGGQGGMMQPVLTYGMGDQGPGKWGMANWFTDCPKQMAASGYCHDKYQAVNEGDTIHFAMQYIRTNSNGWRTWEMSWNALDGGQSSSFMVYWEKDNVEAIWSTEAEFYLDPRVAANHAKMPQSDLVTWDLKATLASGRVLDLQYQGTGSDANAITVNCNSVVDVGGRYLHYQRLGFPGSACPAGYSRDFNYSCQTYCGCNNRDGTVKPTCTYCCRATNKCERANGPSYGVFDDIVAPTKEIFGPLVDAEANEIHPGAMARLGSQQNIFE